MVTLSKANLQLPLAAPLALINNINHLKMEI